MKIKNMEVAVQVVAAQCLAKQLEGQLVLCTTVQTDKAKEIAAAVRTAFEELMSDEISVSINLTVGQD